ncbi:MAG TPA: HAD-IC family P-type ATPase, partial [Burkholderiales bacterium]
MRQPEQQHWWLGPLKECQVALAAEAGGLSGEEAERRRLKWGPNTIHDRPVTSWVALVFTRLRNPLVIVLVLAAGISATVGEAADFYIITAIVLLSVMLDTLQEYRAGHAAEQLQQSVALRAAVLRDRKEHEIPVASIVPGDVALLAAGDLVPADGRLLEARDLFVNQALLTGEPFPVEKHPGDLSGAEASVDQATNAVFAGTSVISGTATMLVVKTGASSAIGAIAGTLLRNPPPSAYEMSLRRFGFLILRLTVALCLFTLAANLWLHRPWLDFFLFSLALAVGLTPELLPMVVSITLSRGAVRMAANRVIVKRLSAIHDLGAVDVLCTDKTGTLTQAEIHLERHVDAAGRPSCHVLHLAYLNSKFQTGLRSPLDVAILEASEQGTGTVTKLDEVPFDFERRRVSVLLDDGKAHLLIVKGAPEAVCGVCSVFEGETGASQPLDHDAATSLRALQGRLEAEGYRVLAVAWKTLPRDQAHVSIGDESGLTFAGFAVFFDPPKPSAAEAMRALQESGVSIKILTGDSDRVARHVCGELGLVTGEVVL